MTGFFDPAFFDPDFFDTGTVTPPPSGGWGNVVYVPQYEEKITDEDILIAWFMMMRY